MKPNLRSPARISLKSRSLLSRTKENPKIKLAGPDPATGVLTRTKIIETKINKTEAKEVANQSQGGLGIPLIHQRRVVIAITGMEPKVGTVWLR